MIAANQVPILDEAERQLRSAMTAAILHAGHRAVCAVPQYDVAAEKLKGLRLAVEPVRGHYRVPEPTQHGLFGH
jgi:hypothetical protein